MRRYIAIIGAFLFLLAASAAPAQERIPFENRVIGVASVQPMLGNSPAPDESGAPVALREFNLAAPVPSARMSPDLALATYLSGAQRQLAELGAYSDATVIEADLPATAQHGKYELRRMYQAPPTLSSPVADMRFDQGPVLCICAHSDDETLGAGGTIWQLRQQGIDVCVAWLCYGVPARPQDIAANLLRIEADNRKEQCMPAAMAVLGVTDHLRLDNQPATRLDLVTLSEVSAKVGKLIEEVKPRVILTHWWHDVHQDHRQVWRAVEVAVRAQPPLPFVPTIATFEILSSTNYALSDSFSPTLFQTLSKRALDAKIEAMAAYTTEFNVSPHPRSVHGITTLAAYRGLQCGREYAEGFQVARMVLDAYTPSSQQPEASLGR